MSHVVLITRGQSMLFFLQIHRARLRQIAPKFNFQSEFSMWKIIRIFLTSPWFIYPWNTYTNRHSLFSDASKCRNNRNHQNMKHSILQGVFEASFYCTYLSASPSLAHRVQAERRQIPDFTLSYLLSFHSIFLMYHQCQP